MKEFRFEPASQMIEVEEGQTLSIAITGYKTAYRYGQDCVRVRSRLRAGTVKTACGYGQDCVRVWSGPPRLAHGRDLFSCSQPHEAVGALSNVRGPL